MSEDINIAVVEEAINADIDDSSAVPDHNDLNGLDEDDYQHLSESAKAALTDGADSDASDLHTHDDLPDLTNFGEKIYAHGDQSGAVVLNRANGGVQTVHPIGDVQFSLANFTDERSQSMELHITSGADHTITWPAGSLYGGEDGAPELSDYDVVAVSSLDGGTIPLITHLESYS